MSVQELSLLHRRYADLSHRFRAGWAFHQFLKNIKKVFDELAIGDLPADFQKVYDVLREVSQNLNTADHEHVRAQLDQVQQQLTQITGALLAEDSKVSPPFLRQFFQRVKNYDDKILTQLVRFYLYCNRGDAWHPDRLDKVDYLLSRLAEEYDESTSTYVLRDRKQLKEILGSLWALVSPEVEGGGVQEYLRAVADIQGELTEVESLDELNDRHLIHRFRDLKHGLGNQFFEPGLALALLETNLKLKNLIQQLYRQEEHRIVTEYQEVFELEREVPFDSALTQELAQLRDEIERFENQLQREELNLNDLARIRGMIRSLSPRLEVETSAEPVAREEVETKVSEAEEAPSAADQPGWSDYREWIAEPLGRLEAALEEVDPKLAPKKVTLARELYSYRLEAREVLAFRRLHQNQDCDRDLETFLVEAAALRMRLNEEAEEIKGLLDETVTTGDAPVFENARRTVEVANAFLWRFFHLQDRTLLAGDFEECQEVQLLKMRLMRDYSGLWLLAHKPFFARRPME